MKFNGNGIELNVTVAGSGRPLLLLHGFTGSAATWQPRLPHLAARRRIVAPDLIGHGQSAAPADPARYTMACCVADLLALLDALAIEQTDLLGYSMGGRVALHLALAAPQRIGALVLESAAPGIADPAERTARAAADNALAAAIECDGIAAFVARWEELPLFASQQRLPPEIRAQQRAQRLQNRPTGLANSLRGMGAGQQESLWERLGELPMPALLLVGALDPKYCTIARQMAALLPTARLVVVPAAGHTIHLEQPAVFDHEILAFLETIANR